MSFTAEWTKSLIKVVITVQDCSFISQNWQLWMQVEPPNWPRKARLICLSHTHIYKVGQIGFLERVWSDLAKLCPSGNKRDYATLILLLLQDLWKAKQLDLELKLYCTRCCYAGVCPHTALIPVILSQNTYSGSEWWGSEGGKSQTSANVLISSRSQTLFDSSWKWWHTAHMVGLLMLCLLHNVAGNCWSTCAICSKNVNY